MARQNEEYGGSFPLEGGDKAFLKQTVLIWTDAHRKNLMVLVFSLPLPRV